MPVPVSSRPILLDGRAAQNLVAEDKQCVARGGYRQNHERVGRVLRIFRGERPRALDCVALVETCDRHRSVRWRLGEVPTDEWRHALREVVGGHEKRSRRSEVARPILRRAAALFKDGFHGLRLSDELLCHGQALSKDQAGAGDGRIGLMPREDCRALAAVPYQLRGALAENVQVAPKRERRAIGVSRIGIISRGGFLDVLSNIVGGRVVRKHAALADGLEPARDNFSHLAAVEERELNGCLGKQKVPRQNANLIAHVKVHLLVHDSALLLVGGQGLRSRGGGQIVKGILLQYVRVDKRRGVNHLGDDRELVVARVDAKIRVSRTADEQDDHRPERLAFALHELPRCHGEHFVGRDGAAAALVVREHLLYARLDVLQVADDQLVRVGSRGRRRCSRETTSRRHANRWQRERIGLALATKRCAGIHVPAPRAPTP